MRLAHALLLFLIPLPATAHGGFAAAWGMEAWTIAVIALALRPARWLPFWVALGVLAAALIWPLGAPAESSLAAHMAQHMLLIAVAAPLLVFSRPALPWLKGVRAGGAAFSGAAWFATPAVAFVLHALVVWMVHAPQALAAVQANEWLHIASHAALFGSAALLWWSLRRRSRLGEACLWTLGTAIHTALLGALLTFAPRVLYRGYALEDQQLAGLVMWIPGGLLYLAAGLGLAAAWLSARERAI
jgi:putative membrane protein